VGACVLADAKCGAVKQPQTPANEPSLLHALLQINP
jgi:hypothetical protein